ncbi:hypothetical protein [Halomonas sp. SL1]|uniref:hypothetical protein n=1 Tax=Halomonas sp. SL1 TaxID=2137478 RepID=UPI0011B93A41|nr:hypothetical protein [Halomonas sp. SL1]
MNKRKLRSVAELAMFCNQRPDLCSDKILPQSLSIAIRKLHDHGESPLGKGKYLGHPFWSISARDLLKANGWKVVGIKRLLSHEHVIPVSLLVRKILEPGCGDCVEDFEEIVSRYSLVAIITREEDVRLREAKQWKSVGLEWVENDPWWRYREAKLFSEMVDGEGCSLEERNQIG